MLCLHPNWVARQAAKAPTAAYVRTTV